MSNKIGWCDLTKNWIWGCNYTKCPFCYARKIAKRFAKEMARLETNFITNKNISIKKMQELIDIWFDSNGAGVSDENIEWFSRWMNVSCKLYRFKPTLLNYKLAQPLPKKPQRIFLDSMSDIADWKPEWYKKILQKINDNPQHTYIILTKRPEIYRKYTFPLNVWLGVSMTKNFDLYFQDGFLGNEFFNLFMHIPNKTFVSIEPIHSEFKKRDLLKLELMVDWLIVGPESGNRKDKIKTKPGWIESFYPLLNIPVFMKSGCSKIINTPLRQEWPE